jgi:hypothetical protein
MLLAGAKCGQDDYHEQGKKILHVRMKFGLALLFQRRGNKQACSGAPVNAPAQMTNPPPTA